MEVHDVTDTDHTHREINSLRNYSGNISWEWDKEIPKVENERIGRLTKIVTCTECSRINDWHFTATNKIVRTCNIVRRVIKWRKTHGPCTKWTRMLVRMPLWPIHLVCFEMTLLLPAVFKWKNATKWRGNVKASLIFSYKAVDSDMDAPNHPPTHAHAHKRKHINKYAVFHCGDPSSIPGNSILDLQRTNWRWDGCFFLLSGLFH